MHQTKKGNQWYFGMKAHIGADSKTKLIHSVVARPRTCMTARCFLICCMVRSDVYGAMRLIPGNVRSSVNARPRRQTSPTKRLIVIVR
jgi:hypothetical protein